MAKKKPPPAPPKPPEFKNNPFAAAKAVIKHVVDEASKPKPAPPPPPPKPLPVATAKTAEADQYLFFSEMAMVAPLVDDPRGRVGVNKKPRPPANWRARENAEAYAELADLVEGVGPFDIVDTDEYIEGLGPGVDRGLLRKLKRGDFAVQAHIDLHGFLAEDAQAEVEAFMQNARSESKRCVLLVHGRGLHSKDGVPILKEKLKVWLSRGRLSHFVLAFATARPSDGGAGAMYVLLRR